MHSRKAGLDPLLLNPTVFHLRKLSAAQSPLPSSLTVDSIEDLKEALIQQLQIEHTMLATTVGKTLNWRESDGTLYISVHTPFEVQQLQREKAVLTKKVAVLYGKELRIQITLAEEQTVQATVPARVEMVLRNFKGTITDIQKKVIEEEPEETE